MLRYILFAGLLATVLAGAAQAGDIWVDDGGSDSTGDGSFNNPYKTVTHVLDAQLAAPGDVIKLKAGTYDEALGESFPFSLPSSVDLVGYELDGNGVPLARLGGDVNDDGTAAVALVLVDASTYDRTGIDITDLYFEGEDFTGKDAPSAVKVISRDDSSVIVSIEHCTIERGEMDDSSSTDRASILLDLGRGASTVTVQDCRIWASPRAGIEVLTGPDTSSSAYADQTINVLANEILLTGSDASLHGLTWYAEGEAWVNCGLTIRSNLIDGTASTAGFGTGIRIGMAPDGYGIMAALNTYNEIVRNRIEGCSGNGLELYTDPQDANATAQIVIWDIDRNRISECGGAAMQVQREDSGGLGGYVNLATHSNWYVDCDVGLRCVGYSSGTFLLDNDTFSGNASWAIELANGSRPPDYLVNCILWGNGGCENCDQYDPGDTGSDPEVNGIAEYCDWDNLSAGQGNIDLRPEFVNAPGGDYHLDSDSPCIDAGDTTPDAPIGLGEFDVDSDDRTLDGDGDNRAHVDIGADEYEP